MNQPTPFTIREIQFVPVGQVAPRIVTAFLPPGFKVGTGPFPVVYSADGGAVSAFGLKLVRGMQDGTVPAVILIGVHCSTEARAEEYLPGVDRERFDAHAEFFTHQHWEATTGSS